MEPSQALQQEVGEFMLSAIAWNSPVVELAEAAAETFMLYDAGGGVQQWVVDMQDDLIMRYEEL